MTRAKALLSICRNGGTSDTLTASPQTYAGDEVIRALGGEPLSGEASGDVAMACNSHCPWIPQLTCLHGISQFFGQLRARSQHDGDFEPLLADTVPSSPLLDLHEAGSYDAAGQWPVRGG
jgi:hypothetical protein